MSDKKFWDQKWYGTYFKEENFQEELKKFTEQRLKEILELIGKSGIKGDRGEAGQAGKQGEQGLKGEKGEKGDRGDTGAQGPVGAQGPQGEAGKPGEKAPEKSKEVTPAPEKPADNEANQTPERRNGNMAKTPVANNHRRLPATGEQANPFFTAAVAVMTTAGVLAVTKRKENN